MIEVTVEYSSENQLNIWQIFEYPNKQWIMKGSVFDVEQWLVDNRTTHKERQVATTSMQYGQGIVEEHLSDFATLELRALAHVEQLKEETPDPLTEVLDELVRDSEESTSRTTHEM